MSRAEEGTNRLIHEKSPYLLQHARNPVDWYPWGEEAFEEARRSDKPIFLSIGYSTCHWCHVMEKESFEDPQVAAAMNETFINIKVDREERPDVDGVYMTVCQMLTGQGGWPLTIIMTPDHKPFFAGTYFPRESRFGRPGMFDIITRIRQVWAEDRDQVVQSADRIADALLQSVERDHAASGEPQPGILDTAFQELSERFDNQFGGFGTKPKFPTPHNYLFLLRYWKRSGDARALDYVEKSLRSMRAGGMYDQIGFGFHRYSTDERWLVPHFEKMLYDQALLATAYLETYQATGDPFYLDTADEVFEYVLRDMTSDEGGFYTAEDADSEGEEGKFYVWTADELRNVLGADDAAYAEAYFGVTKEGNYVDEVTRETTGANILHVSRWSEKTGGESDAEVLSSDARLESIRTRLLEKRSERIRPHLDDKLLTDWNGLLIRALALSARVADRPQNVVAAERAARFFLDRMLTDEGRLLHRYRDGEVGIIANIDDHAFLVSGLIELFQTTNDPAYLGNARALTDVAIDQFWDDSSGGFFFTPRDGETLLIRQKEYYDGAVPSGNSVFLDNLLKLARLLASVEYEAIASKLATSSLASLQRSSSSHTMLLSGLDFAFSGAREVVLVEGENEGLEAMRDVLRTLYVPNKVVLIVPRDQQAREDLLKVAPYLAAYRPREGRSTAFVCERQICEQPTTDPAVLRKQLGG